MSDPQTTRTCNKRTKKVFETKDESDITSLRQPLGVKSMQKLQMLRVPFMKCYGFKSRMRYCLFNLIKYFLLWNSPYYQISARYLSYISISVSLLTNILLVTILFQWGWVCIGKVFSLFAPFCFPSVERE